MLSWSDFSVANLDSNNHPCVLHYRSCQWDVCKVASHSPPRIVIFHHSSSRRGSWKGSIIDGSHFKINSNLWKIMGTYSNSTTGLKCSNAVGTVSSIAVTNYICVVLYCIVHMCTSYTYIWRVEGVIDCSLQFVLLFWYPLTLRDYLTNIAGHSLMQDYSFVVIWPWEFAIEHHSFADIEYHPVLQLVI